MIFRSALNSFFNRSAVTDGYLATYIKCDVCVFKDKQFACKAFLPSFLLVTCKQGSVCPCIAVFFNARHCLPCRIIIIIKTFLIWKQTGYYLMSILRSICYKLVFFLVMYWYARILGSFSLYDRGLKAQLVYSTITCIYDTVFPNLSSKP